MVKVQKFGIRSNWPVETLPVRQDMTDCTDEELADLDLTDRKITRSSHPVACGGFSLIHKGIFDRREVAIKAAKFTQDKIDDVPQREVNTVHSRTV